MATTATALYVGAQPRRRAVPRTAVLGVALLLLVLLLAPLLFGAPSQQPCRTPAAAADVPQLTASQEANAQVIAAEGERAGVGLRGVIVALAAAMQESSLENRTTGDLDSLGLFQQRPSVGWGTPAQILTPELAADAFYGIADHTTNSGLLDIPGWEAMSVAEAAQAVQRSAFPDAYATWETLATQLATRLLGGAAGARARLRGDVDLPTRAGAAPGRLRREPGRPDVRIHHRGRLPRLRLRRPDRAPRRPGLGLHDQRHPRRRRRRGCPRRLPAGTRR